MQRWVTVILLGVALVAVDASPLAAREVGVRHNGGFSRHFMRADFRDHFRDRARFGRPFFCGGFRDGFAGVDCGRRFGRGIVAGDFFLGDAFGWGWGPDWYPPAVQGGGTPTFIVVNGQTPPEQPETYEPPSVEMTPQGVEVIRGHGSHHLRSAAAPQPSLQTASQGVVVWRGSLSPSNAP